MIKLAVTDVDGTLIKDGSHELNTDMFDIIRELKRKGIIFAVASGRQYTSIKRLFEPVADDMIFVSENGAYVMCRENEMSVVRMNQKKAREFIKYIRTLGNGCIANVSTPYSTYIDSRDEEFYDLLVNGYHNRVTVVDDLLKEDLDIIKISIYRKDGIADMAYNQILPLWQDVFKGVVAGKEWLDFMDLSVDKGNALAEIQRLLRILPEETMAFGDNVNDIGMLKMAGESYAVETACDEVKSYAKHIADGYTKEGVIEILRQLAYRKNEDGGAVKTE